MTNPLDHIAEIGAWLAATNIDRLELAGPLGRIFLNRDAGAPLHAAAQIVTSPGVGLFLTIHPLHDAPLVPAGARVKTGQTLGLLQIGALLVPVVSPCDGVLACAAAGEGALAGFGDSLFEIHPEAGGEPHAH